MFNFTKIFGLAGAALLFAGFAAAQDTCTTVVPNTVLIDRGDGTTELLPTITISCAGTGVAATAGTPITLQLFLSLPVTSKAIGGGFTEAQVNSGFSGATPPVAEAGGNLVQGTVSGSNVTFTGITVPAGGFSLVINNLRVNASGAGVVAGGSPVAVNGTAFISGPAPVINPAVLTIPTVALLENGLAPAGVFSGPSPAAGVPSLAPTGSGRFNSPTVCQSNSSGFFAEYIQVNEGFPAAFKSAAGEASQVPVTGTTSTNTVVDGTRVQITFANVPANVNIYVPVGALTSTTGGDVLTYTLAGPGTPFFAATGTFPTSTQTVGLALPALSLTQVPISSGTGTAVFEETTVDNNTSGKFNIPIYYMNSSFAVPAGTTSGITATVSLSPTGSTVVPNFATTSQTAFTTSVFNLCSTTLLFPFLTNQLGFDTGLTIANTTTDPLGGSGATPQSGLCTLNFYGTGAPSPSAVMTPSVPTGTVYTQVLSGIAAGFQGYMIAQCTFQGAHGFAFITDGVGSAGGLSQGYLAGVIITPRPTTESLGF